MTRQHRDGFTTRGNRTSLIWKAGLCLGVATFMTGVLAMLVGQRNLFAALGTWAIGRGRATLAENWLGRAQQRAPESGEAPFNLGVVLYGQRRFEPAADSFSKALSRSQTDVDRSASLYNLASSYVGAGRLAEALDCLEGSLRANPADESARYNYVLVKRWLAENNSGPAQALSPPPEMTKEEVERLLNQLGAVPLRAKSRKAPVPTGKPDW